MTSAEQHAPTIPAPPIKTCACSRSYDALAWASLPAIGVMPDGAGNVLVLKNCPAPCFSTLAVEVAS